MKLFVGLGNPGEKHAGNRHNIGFMAVERIAHAHGFGPWKKKFNSLISEGTLGSSRVTLMMPQTFMNDSGRAVGEAMRFLKIEADSIAVFHDELDLLPGKVKVKTGGGNAGHNGLRSISAHIGNEYLRVRLGIGHPGSKDAVVYYVLNDFAKSERAWLKELLDAVAEAAPHLAKADSARFLNDVAMKTQAGMLDEADAKLPAREKPLEPTAKSTKIAHPAGERDNKRQSALAENLKKWLSGRKSDE